MVSREEVLRLQSDVTGKSVGDTTATHTSSSAEELVSKSSGDLNVNLNVIARELNYSLVLMVLVVVVVWNKRRLRQKISTRTV